MNKPLPLEKADPEFAQLIQGVLRTNQKVGRRVIEIYDGHVFVDYSSPSNPFVPRVEIYEDKETVPGRNDPCFCGSGKKFKKCCGG